MKKFKKEKILKVVEQVLAENKPEGELVPFEIYFHLLCGKDKKVMPHHFEALKKFAERDGTTLATKEQWEETLKGY